MPQQSHPGAAAYDLGLPQDITIPAGTTLQIPLFISMKFHEIRSCGRIIGRSSATGRKLTIIEGTIDSDYQGELFMSIRNDSDETQNLERGLRIAQIMILRLPEINKVYHEHENVDMYPTISHLVHDPRYLSPECCKQIIISSATNDPRRQGKFGSTGDLATPLAMGLLTPEENKEIIKVRKEQIKDLLDYAEFTKDLPMEKQTDINMFNTWILLNRSLETIEKHREVSDKIEKLKQSALEKQKQSTQYTQSEISTYNYGPTRSETETKAGPSKPMRNQKRKHTGNRKSPEITERSENPEKPETQAGIKRKRNQKNQKSPKIGGRKQSPPTETNKPAEKGKSPINITKSNEIIKTPPRIESDDSLDYADLEPIADQIFRNPEKADNTILDTPITQPEPETWNSDTIT